MERMTNPNYAIVDNDFTTKLAKETKDKDIINAYEHGELRIIKSNSIWSFVDYPENLFWSVRHEMKRLFPTLTYYYDLKIMRK